MGNKILVELDKEKLKENCTYIGGRYCIGCQKTDEELLICNIKITGYKIKEQNNGNKGTED